MTIQKYIRVGFFEKFKGEDSILISADIHGLLELESIFQILRIKGNSIQLKDLKNIDLKHSIPLTLSSSDKNEGFRKKESGYEWKLTPEKWSEFRDKVISLYKNGFDGHQFLDAETTDHSDLQVVLSLNEYNLEFWEKFK